MPDRFQWLEFEAGEAPAPGAAAADPHAVMQEARRAFLEGDYEVALQHYSSALKQDKALHEAWAGQVRCLVRLHELREAQAWAVKACGLFPGVALLESARAGALAASGLVHEARSASDDALELAERANLQEPHLWLERAAVLLADGQKPTARLCLAKLRELCPDDPDWEQRIALELLETGDLTGALDLLNTVTAKRPGWPYAWLLTAQAARRLGMKDRALQALDEADRLRPDWPPAVRERQLLKRPCWIATLVFRHEDHPAVRALRAWRDERWLTWAGGRAAARLYDRTAPAVCGVLAHRPAAQRILKTILEHVARYHGQTQGPGDHDRPGRDGAGARHRDAGEAMPQDQGDPGGLRRTSGVPEAHLGVL